jgi:hypothetical protein
MGLVDPTAGTLAGMFIDRMRSAQMQEGAQQPSVAQQVFAPPAPPAPPMGGMGPPPGAPPMGAPPMGGGCLLRLRWVRLRWAAASRCSSDGHG